MLEFSRAKLRLVWWEAMIRDKASTGALYNSRRFEERQMRVAPSDESLKRVVLAGPLLPTFSASTPVVLRHSNTAFTTGSELASQVGSGSFAVPLGYTSLPWEVILDEGSAVVVIAVKPLVSILGTAIRESSVNFASHNPRVTIIASTLGQKNTERKTIAQKNTATAAVGLGIFSTIQGGR